MGSPLTTEGFMRPGLICRYPDFPPIVGYAATATFAAQQPAARPSDPQAYYESVLAQPAPRISVAQDLDEEPIGALFGEVTACTKPWVAWAISLMVVCVTLMKSARSASSSYQVVCWWLMPTYIWKTSLPLCRWEVCIIPPEVAPHLAEACRSIEAAEQHSLMALARSSEFTVAEYVQARVEFTDRLTALSADFRRRIASQ